MRQIFTSGWISCLSFLVCQFSQTGGLAIDGYAEVTFPNSPKVWALFLKQILELIFRKTHLEMFADEYGLPGLIELVQRFTRTFIENSHKIQVIDLKNLTDECGVWRTVMIEEQGYSEFIGETTLTRPTGVTSMSDTSETVRTGLTHHGTCTYPIHGHHWTILLHNLLRFEIHFLTLFFKSPYQRGQCKPKMYFQKFSESFFSGHRGDNGHVEISSCHKKKNGKRKWLFFWYCGTLSNFKVFLRDFTSFVGLQVKPHIQFNVSFSYTAMDRSIIHTMNNSEDASPLYSEVFSALAPSSILLVTRNRSSTYLQVYHLLCEKSHIFVIVIPVISSVTAYDGPGTLSRTLTAHFLKASDLFQFRTSAFRATVFEQSAISNLKLSYMTRRGRLPKLILLNKPQGVSLDSERQGNIVSHFQLKSASDLHINLTIIDVNYTGKKSPACIYAGVSFYNVETHSTEPTFCQSSEYYHRYQPMYSENTSMEIILFSFEEYGSVAINLFFSFTQCAPIHVSLCPLREARYTGSFALYANMENIDNVQIYNHEHFMRPDAKEMKFALRDNTCVIFQFALKSVPVYGLKFADTCLHKMLIYHAPIAKHGINIRYNIQGFELGAPGGSVYFLFHFSLQTFGLICLADSFSTL